jgi:3-dehydroquinate synthase
MKFKQDISLTIQFPVLFKKDIFSTPVGEYWHEVIAPNSQAAAIFFIDENVAKCHPTLIGKIQAWNQAFSGLRDNSQIHVVPAGEALKNDFVATVALSEKMVEAKLCRHSYVFIIGGGAVLDAVGFAASITHRGIRQLRIPTTVLSQDDSAMGVKNGTNFNGIKNLLGTFCAPHAVICDGNFLDSLEQRDWVSGVSEAFKVAIIKDREFFDFLAQHAHEIPQRNPIVMAQLVKHSAKIHLNHIAMGGDPFETGSSRPLDFGHWSAHKLESMSRGALRHGEAVSIGIALDLFCAETLGLIAFEEIERILKAMQTATLPIWSDFLNQREELVEGLREFQEHIGGDLTLAMPHGLGKLIEINKLSTEVVDQAINKLKQYLEK